MSVEDLILAYQNEKGVEELLPYEEAVVGYFVEAIGQQMELARSVELTIRSVYELETERIRYFLKEYLSTRIHKMQGNLYLDASLLSERERVFYERYLGLLEKRDVRVARREGTEDAEFVGFYALVDMSNVRIDGSVVEVFKGDFFVGPFADVREFVKSKEMALL
jgi:GINS complex subunit 4